MAEIESLGKKIPESGKIFVIKGIRSNHSSRISGIYRESQQIAWEGDCEIQKDVSLWIGRTKELGTWK